MRVGRYGEDDRGRGGGRGGSDGVNLMF
jgi:hypothetical protein